MLSLDLERDLDLDRDLSLGLSLCRSVGLFVFISCCLFLSLTLGRRIIKIIYAPFSSPLGPQSPHQRGQGASFGCLELSK